MTETNPVLRLVATVCAIVAIALVAATIRSPLETRGSTDGDGSGAEGPPEPPDQPTDSGVPEFLEVLLSILVVLVALALVWYLLAHRREAVTWIAAGVVAVFVFVGFAYLLLVEGIPLPEPASPEATSAGEWGDSGDGDASGADGNPAPVPTGPLLAVLAVVTAVFLGGLFLTRDPDGPGATGAESDVVGDQDQRTDDGTTRAVGSAAGEAADRIENDTDVENAVYRAWREMTAPLEVDRPESSTPREFASAATEAGMNRTHVEELTRLFEEVRYGNAPTTPDREARALAILRRIESEYADGRGGESDERPGRDHTADGSGHGTDDRDRWGGRP